MIYKSSFSKDELINRWDELTSPSRFAGADDELDWIYNGKRAGDRVRLVKKPRAAYDPYATVFRGRIISTNNGSAIKGVYAKSAADYVITAVISAIYFGVCSEYIKRADDKLIPFLLVLAGVALILFVLIPSAGKRKKYGEFIRQITGDEPVDTADTENAHGEKKQKYKFR